jgi:predicted metal-dependent peptidase
MSVEIELEKRISASLLRLQTRSPFFATLALFTHIRMTTGVPRAATDGQDIFINPEFVRSLPTPALDGLLLHEVLHAALLHVVRRQTREHQLWNIAADIVVNGMVAQEEGMTLPKGSIRDTNLEHLSVEEIYELLQKQSFLKQPCSSCSYSLTLPDLLEPTDDAEDCLGSNRKAALEPHWRNAMQQAITIAQSSQNQGSIPAGFGRELSYLTQPQIDWRTYLWRYLVRTPTDFTGFDRRFIGQKLYLEALEGESVKVYIAIDTSGSVGDRELGLFLGEVRGILQSYPHLVGELYYADADAYGSYELNSDSPIPKPIGGGGTSFIPFFEQVKNRHQFEHQAGGCVYLTDGFGSFPSNVPELPVLWVVTPGGLDLKQFPFGEAVRLLSK